MADYTDNALLASIKALDQVVLPAVDPADPLASEQLRLVSGFLKFLRSRLPHWHARHHFELGHYLDLARQLTEEASNVSGEVSLRLHAALELAQAVRTQEAPSIQNVREATEALAAPIAALSRLAAGASPALRRRVEQKVMAASKRWVDMQRAWFLPQGFELSPGDLPALEAALLSDLSRP
jgi:hypothetical protein